jgi:hypothetical protein
MLHERTNSIEAASEAMRQKIAIFRSNYESTLQERNTLRDQVEELQSAYETQLRECTAELDRLTVRNRSLELEMKTNENRFECEKRTISSQLKAKLLAYQNDCERHLRETVEEQRSIIDDIITEAAKYSELPGPVDAVRQICRQLDELSQQRSQYLAWMDDATSAQELLGVNGSQTSLSAAVHRVLNELTDAKTAIAQLRILEQSLKAERSQLQTEVRNSRDQASGTNQWLLWARRIHSIVYHAPSNALSTEELRLGLEEAIVLSVAHRPFLFKISLLRDEKRILLRVPRAAMAERSQRPVGARALVFLFMAVGRMQQCACCVPVLPPLRN